MVPELLTSESRRVFSEEGNTPTSGWFFPISYSFKWNGFPLKAIYLLYQGTGKAGMILFHFWNVSDNCASKTEKEKAGCSQHENQTVFISDGQGMVPNHPYPSKEDKIPSCTFSHSCHLQIGWIEAPNQCSSVVLLDLPKEQVGHLKWSWGAWHSLKRQREGEVRDGERLETLVGR